MPRPEKRIAYAITSHGYGHLTRSVAVLEALHALCPRVDIVVCTGIPEQRVARELSFPFTYRCVEYEPGTAQKNCFEVDVEATREAYRCHFEDRGRRLREEEAFLRDCHGVVSDIPALPVRAAANVGIPAVGVSNFTWDWILEPLLRGTDLEGVLPQLTEDYASGQLFLRLPFSPDVSPFPATEDTPLVGRTANPRLDEIATQLRRAGVSIRDDRRRVLVSVGGWDANAWSSIHVSGCEAFQFLLVGEMPITADSPVVHLPHYLPAGVTFSDLVAVSDIVLTKPGYGICSECVLNRTPLVGVERRGFRESVELVKGLKNLGPFVELSLDDFFAGNWEPALRDISRSTVSWQESAVDGATHVAWRLGECFGLP